MAFGVLEPSSPGAVPATVILDERAQDGIASLSSLKRSGEVQVVLVPQPTDDPNDPLNWTQFEKYVVFLILCMGSLSITVTPQPLLNAGLQEIAVDLQRSLTDVTKMSGYLLLATGAIGPFASAFGRKFGRRPIYVTSSILGLIGCIVCESAKTYSTLLAGRVIQGVGAAAYESLIVASIGDLFFVHERGSKIAVVVFLMAAISNGVSIIAGVITKNLGWPYNFHILLPFVALQTILCILFAPETMYVRDNDAGVIAQAPNSNIFNESPSGKDMEQHIENMMLDPGLLENKVMKEENTLNSVTPVARKSFVQRMSFYNGTFTDDSILKMLLACPAILLNLSVSYSVFVSGTVIAWFVGVSMISSLIFTAPQYNFTTSGVGYAGAGPLVGGLLGTALMGIISDRQVRWISRRNHGIYEPEFRLIPMIAGLVFSVAGLCGLGHAIEAKVSAYLLCFIWGLMLFGMTIVASVTTSYILDAYPQHRVETYVMNMMYKNFLFYGVSNFMVNWYISDSPSKVFDILGGITAAMCLVSVPVYVLGKKYRGFWGRHNFIEILHLQTKLDPGECDTRG